jgi:hypothetical protein
MPNKACIVPEIAALYEAVTFAREGGDVIVEAYQAVGPLQDDPQYRSWKDELQRHLGKSGRRIQYVVKLPYPIQPVSPGIRRVYQDRGPLDPEPTPTRSNPLMPSLRKAMAKYGGTTYKSRFNDGGGVLVFGGRYFGGYEFRGGPTPRRLKPDNIDPEVGITYAALNLWKKALREQLGPLYGPFTKVRRAPRADVTSTRQVSDFKDRFGNLIDYWSLGRILTLANYAETDPAPFFQKLETLRERGVDPVEVVFQASRDLDRYFPSPSERVRYARTFQKTLSADKALKSIFPNVKASAKTLRMEGLDMTPASKIKAVFNFSPDPISTFKRFRTRGPGGGLSVHEKVFSLLSTDLDLRMRASEIRDLIHKKKYGPREIHMLTDSIRMLREHEAGFAESVEGRRYLMAFQNRDWPRLYREHDAIAAAANVFIERKARARRGLAAKKRAGRRRWFQRFFTFLPGMYPLMTSEDFEKEGRQMDHCIASYRMSANLLHMHITHPETGEMSTVQFDMDGNVRQHYGPRNEYPTQEQEKYLEEFKLENTPSQLLQQPLPERLRWSLAWKQKKEAARQGKKKPRALTQAAKNPRRRRRR